jgi:3-oxoacyl-[acyl-carrier protein] reductase
MAETSRSNSLDGKVALVTGGSRGIGASIARRLAREGASVAITYLHDEVCAAQVVLSIGDGIAIQADSAIAGDLQEAVARTMDAFGALDIVVSNAGVLIEGLIQDVTIEEFDLSWKVNARALFVLVKAAIPHMKPGGRIVSIGSTCADHVPTAGGAAYAATKAAVAAMVRGLSRDLGPLGINVVNVQPGPTATDSSPMKGPNASITKRLLALGREGQPDEIASMVAYLVGPEATFVTGASLTVDGGYSA